MTKEEEEKMLFTKQILINQQLLKAIIILLCPTRLDGINIIRECINNIEKIYDKVTGEKDEI